MTGDFVTHSLRDGTSLPIPTFCTRTPAAEAAEAMSAHKETDQSACSSSSPSRASSSFPQPRPRT